MLANLIEDFEKINVYIYICQPQGIFNYKKWELSVCYITDCLFNYLLIWTESFIKIISKMNLTKKFDGHVFVTVNDAVENSNERWLSRSGGGSSTRSRREII
jgi:hypothetical protein